MSWYIKGSILTKPSLDNSGIERLQMNAPFFDLAGYKDESAVTLLVVRELKHSALKLIGKLPEDGEPFETHGG
jgi:hypothetical protein